MDSSVEREETGPCRKVAAVFHPHPLAHGCFWPQEALPCAVSVLLELGTLAAPWRPLSCLLPWVASPNLGFAYVPGSGEARPP